MEQLHRVSIIMGAFNAERTLLRAVQSILDQTYDDWSLIICDDGSTDSTLALAQSLSERHSRITVIASAANEGLTSALNKCLAACGADDIIVRQDADDISHPDRLARSLDFLQQCGADFIGTAVDLYDEDGVWGRRAFPQAIDKKTLARYNAFMHPTMIFASGVLQRFKYREAYRCEDYELVMRMYAHGLTGQNMQDALVDYYENRRSRKKHTFRSRMSEVRTRFGGLKAMRAPFWRYVYCLKPLLLLLIPNRLYTRLHNKKYQKPIQ